MGWWDDDDDIVGDQPADDVRSAWRRLLDRQRERGLGAPTPDEAFGAFSVALRAAAVEPPCYGLVLTRQGEPSHEYRGEHGDPTTVQIFAEALGNIVATYIAWHDRAPRPSEIAFSLDFVLGGAPASYVEGLDDGFRIAPLLQP